jgi:hypothetical protein
MPYSGFCKTASVALTSTWQNTRPSRLVTATVIAIVIDLRIEVLHLRGIRQIPADVHHKDALNFVNPAPARPAGCAARRRGSKPSQQQPRRLLDPERSRIRGSERACGSVTRARTETLGRGGSHWTAYADATACRLLCDGRRGESSRTGHVTGLLPSGHRLVTGR